MEVRLATIEDAEELYRLNELFGNSSTIEAIRQSLQENDREIVCIAYIDGIAAGFCAGLIAKSMCHIRPRVDIEAVFVREEYRRQGVGRALMSLLEKEAVSRGVYHFHLNTHSMNTAAQTLYEKSGYERTEEILFEKTIS